MTEESKKNITIKVCERCKREKKIRCKGLCKNCYNIIWTQNKFKDAPLKPCACKPDCPAMIRAWDKMGKPLKYKKGHFPKGKDHHCWKGGVYPDAEGYLLQNAFDHPFRNANNQVRQHRLVYEHYLYILFDEHIYIPKEVDIDHINGIRDDNRIINLRPMYKADHNSHHKLKYGPNTKCSNPECKSPYETYIRKNGYPMWFETEKYGILCNRCYAKIKNTNRFGPN